MRALLALTCLFWAAAAPALETARALAAAGAPQLALARVVELQPRERAAPAWAEWEALRLDLLVALGRHGEVLKRVTMLPDGMPPRALKACLLAASRAAAGAGDGASARLYAARVLWRLEPDAAEAATSPSAGATRRSTPCCASSRITARWNPATPRASPKPCSTWAWIARR
jgi:hypothetical protein